MFLELISRRSGEKEQRYVFGFGTQNKGLSWTFYISKQSWPPGFACIPSSLYAYPARNSKLSSGPRTVLPFPQRLFPVSYSHFGYLLASDLWAFWLWYLVLPSPSSLSSWLRMMSPLASLRVSDCGHAFPVIYTRPSPPLCLGTTVMFFSFYSSFPLKFLHSDFLFYRLKQQHL